MRLGVFGGTFDPPHLAHLILAELACDQQGLDSMLWVPAGEPPHKRDWRVTSVQHRVEMVRHCIEDNASFRLSLVDVERTGPHFTVDTLKLLTEQYPAAELFLVIGGDSLHDLPSWHSPSAVLQYANLLVMKRPNSPVDVELLETQLPEIRQRTIFIDAPLIDISGRDIRTRVSQGRSIRYLVPESVVRYILRHNLYRSNED